VTIPTPATPYLGDAATDTLLAFLERRRCELGLSHNGFSKWLGINHATWSLIRRGLAPVGPAFIGRVVVACPEAALLTTRVQHGPQRNG
jgi:hypothetical protein